jgi:hypothetical protein
MYRGLYLPLTLQPCPPKDGSASGGQRRGEYGGIKSYSVLEVVELVKLKRAILQGEPHI